MPDQAGGNDLRVGTGPAPTDADYITIHSRGYSRYEIADNGDILVVYTGGVEFAYRGYALRANELRFDQATRQASVSGDVEFTARDFSLSTQSIELDGVAGHGEISGHLVGSLVKSGVRFEADSALLTFPPGSQQLNVEQTQLTLSGSVAVFGHNGLELHTDQVALDGGTRRFSTAPFTLSANLSVKQAQPARPLQVTGTAAEGLLTDKGELAEMSLLDVLAVTDLGRFSAAQAIARPDPAAGAWKVEITGQPVRLELASRNDNVKLPGQKAAQPSGPILAESTGATVLIDKDGVRSANLTGGVTLTAAGNRLAAASVSVDRRDKGYAFALGGLTFGLDLARLTGIKPVDLSELIK